MLLNYVNYQQNSLHFEIKYVTCKSCYISIGYINICYSIFA